jgi:Mce-associated membrane protein
MKLKEKAPAAPAGTEHAPRRPRTRARMLILGALLAVVVGLAVAGGLAGGTAASANDQNQERTAVLAAARQEVLSIISISSGSLSSDLSRIAAGATGDFKTEVTSQKSSFSTIIKQQKVTSSGSIAAAGVESVKGDKATVLVAATATVKNTQSPKGAARDYRMQVTLQKVNGHWLAAQMEFVP